LTLIENGIDHEIEKNASTFQRETVARLERAFGDSYSRINLIICSEIIDDQQATAHIFDSIIQYLVLPMFAVDELGNATTDNVCTTSKKRGRSEANAIPQSAFTVTKNVYHQMTVVPEEQNAVKRTSLVASVKACEAIELELRAFREKHGTQGPDAAVRLVHIHVDDSFSLFSAEISMISLSNTSLPASISIHQ
jgi:hypothetical protein